MNDYRMITEVVSSFSGLLQLLERGVESSIFRGVQDETFELLPGAGRFSLTPEQERSSLRSFKSRALPYLRSYLPRNDFEWLILAQHHGLPTRLLDWSLNPLVASFFAVQTRNYPEAAEGPAAAIYRYDASRDLTLATDDLALDPFQLPELRLLISGPVSDRIPPQGGVFTIYPNPLQPFSSARLTKVVIPWNIRREIRRGLRKFGIFDEMLFRDLDGLCLDIKSQLLDL